SEKSDGGIGCAESGGAGNVRNAGMRSRRRGTKRRSRLICLLSSEAELTSASKPSQPRFVETRMRYRTVSILGGLLLAATVSLSAEFPATKMYEVVEVGKG